MTKLSHPEMGSVNSNSYSGGPETYIVEDANNIPDPIDERLSQFEAPAQNVMSGAEIPIVEKKQITKDLEKLIFIGKLTKEVEISGVTFELSTLTNREHNEIVRMMYSFAEAADLFTIRLITLANAIKFIDGVSIDSINIDGQFESPLHKRIAVVDYLQLSVVEKLYSAYEDLIGVEKDLSEKNEEIKK